MEEYEQLKTQQSELLKNPEQNALALNAIGEEIDRARRELNLPLEENDGNSNPTDPID